MRKFRIVGIADGEFNLNSSDYFLYNPKNLGIKIANTYSKISNIRIKTDESVEFQDVTGNLKIKNYEKFELFRLFLAKNRNSGFYLYYTDAVNPERFIECDFVLLTKTELEQDDILWCDCTITPRTYWQKSQKTITHSVSGNSEGKKYVLNEAETDPLFAYAYKYKLNAEETDPLFKYAYTYSVGTVGVADVTNSGDFEVPVKIKIDGDVLNPLIQLYDASNTKISEAKINVEVTAGQQLIINSSPDDLKIVLVDTDGTETDQTANQDFTKVNYITIPVGSHTLLFTEENGSAVTASVEILNTYLGV